MQIHQLPEFIHKQVVIAQYRALMHRVLSSANKLQPQNKIKATILLLDGIATFTCVLCNFLAHLTFPMRKVLVTRNSTQTTRCSPLADMDN